MSRWAKEVIYQLLGFIKVAKGEDTGTYSVIAQEERDGWLVKVYDAHLQLVQSEEVFEKTQEKALAKGERVAREHIEQHGWEEVTGQSGGTE